MDRTSIAEGKERLEQLVDLAENGEPQIIVDDGVPAAVIVSFHEYLRLTAKKGSLSELLLNCPLRGTDIELDITRDPDFGRPTIDFSEENDEYRPFPLTASR